MSFPYVSRHAVPSTVVVSGGISISVSTDDPPTPLPPHGFPHVGQWAAPSTVVVAGGISMSASVDSPPEGLPEAPDPVDTLSGTILVTTP